MKNLFKSKYAYVKDLYRDKTDEDLIAEFRNGNTFAVECLVKRYIPVSMNIISSFYLVGAELEDLFQESMISLNKAIKDYDPKKDCSFKYYAIVCIKRYIITVIRRNSRKKHSPLNNYISISNAINEDDEQYVPDRVSEDVSSNPEYIVVSRERENMVTNVLENNLSEFEKKVLSCHFSGLSYNQSSEILNTDTKAIDNAMQRIRRKIRTELKSASY